MNKKEIKVCTTCKATKINEIKKIIKNEKEFELSESKCLSICGIGRFKKALIYNNKVFQGDDYNLLIKEIKDED